MNLTVDEELIQSLNFISQQLSRYLSPIIFLFGFVGNTLNCLVLSQRRLRTNTCALIFLLSSCSDLISIVVGLPTRILAGWDLDPTTTNNFICKFRAFTVFSTRTIGIWLIALATIDRWLLSCVDNHRRQLSTIKNVKLCTVIIIILGILCYGHMLFCYQANMTDSPLRCYGNTEHCRLATDLIYIVISNLIPLILMVTFGLLTIYNARHIRNRIQHQDTPPNQLQTNEQRHARKTDYQLLRMLCIQILFLILLCIPQAVEKFYVTFQPLGSGSELDDTMKIFFYNIELLLAFVASGMPFYIYTLAGGVIFRKAISDFLYKIVRNYNESP